jgi:predicted O-methyltransferase YrrM
MSDKEAVIRQQIVDLYGARILRKSALNIRGGAGVFERVLKGKGHKVALEIGTYRGCAAAEIAQYVARVITIDLEHGKLEADGELWDRDQFWQSLGVHNITFHAVSNDKQKAALVNSIEFDFAFIDGAHDRTVSNDFELVRRCGRVLFHDYDRRGGPGQDHVCDFVDSLPKEQVEQIDIFALWTAP